jgi:hypothetical protein
MHNLRLRQHMWFNIKDFKMLDGPTSYFTTKYARPYEIIVKLDPNVYT